MKSIFTYLGYLKPHKKLFIIGTVCSLIFGVSSGLGVPFAIQVVFQKIFTDQETQYTLWQLLGVVSILVGMFVLRGAFGFLGGYFLSSVGIQISVALQKNIFAKVQSLPLSYFDKTQTGDIITKLNNDTNLVQKMILEIASETIKQPAQMISGLATIIWLSFQYDEILYILLFFASIPIFVIPVRLIGSRLKKRGRQLQESSREITQHLTENLGALQEVRSFGLEQKQKDEFMGKLGSFANFNLKLKKYQLTQQPSMEIISVCVLSVVFIFAYNKGVSFDIFSKLGAALYFTFDPLKKILKMVNFIHRTEGARDRIQEILDAPLEIEDPSDPTPIDRLQGDIQFNQVEFGYEAEQPVLKNITSHILPQTVIALVGASGAGKSTFAKLVSRFYDVTSGSITIDGIDIREMLQSDLRKNIAVVSQQPVLFDDTIYNNIALGNPEASRETIIEAAQKAYANDFIEALEAGYETMAGERGDRLSGGQKQRIAIARAFVKDAPILVLDEATSALDAESEKYIQLALDNLIKNKTVLIIAHRLSSIKHADRIFVFDKGEIVEEGTHDELLEKGNHYHRLYKTQIQ